MTPAQEHRVAAIMRGLRIDPNKLATHDAEIDDAADVVEDEFRARMIMARRDKNIERKLLKGAKNER
jgi:hypothetical protein